MKPTQPPSMPTDPTGLETRPTWIIALTSTLDRANDTLDPTVLNELADRRNLALTAKRHPQPALSSLKKTSFAAGWILFFAYAGIDMLSDKEKTIANTPAVVHYWEEDPDMLEDWELIDTVGDADAS